MSGGSTGRTAGKVVLVTGAARGQGRSHAIRLAQEGADLMLVDVCQDNPSVSYPLAREEDLTETVRLVEKLDRRVVAARVDVRDRVRLFEFVTEAVAELGRLDAVVANAGILPLGAQGPPAAFLDAVGVNLVGTINTLEAALPHLGPGASVVCIGSTAALASLRADSPAMGPGGAGYTHSKRAVARLVHDLARALGPQHIRVNAVHPVNCDTDMLHNQALYKVYRPDLERPGRADVEPVMTIGQPIPVPYVEPIDVSNAVLYLVSEESRYVTGAQLRIDAGNLLSSTTSGAPA